MLVDDTTPDGRFADVDGKLLDHNPYEDDETAGDETDAADETEEETGGRDRRGNFRCDKGDDSGGKRNCE